MQCPVEARPPSSEILDDAVRFLADGLSTDGLWRDFRTLAGASSEWVSGFVCHQVAGCGRLDAEAARALRALAYRQRPDGGWSYNSRVPCDADSTAWVLVAIGAAQNWRLSSVVTRGMRFLLAHRHNESGAFTTYRSEDGIESFIGLGADEVTGWRDGHLCVTASAMQAVVLHTHRQQQVDLGASTRFVLERRQADGLWRAYWWVGWSYATYQALRALRLARALPANDADISVRSILRAQHDDGSWSDTADEGGEAFATAFAILSLLLFPQPATVEAAVAGLHWLAREQRYDGSWPVVPVLRLPPPQVHDPAAVKSWRTNGAGTAILVADERRLFTTAAVVRAFSVFAVMTGSPI